MLRGEAQVRAILDALPAAIYMTDEAGRITYYNQAAVDLAGRKPKLGTDEWCVTWRLYRPDGTRLAHDECPMAVALKEGRAVSGEEAVAERPDGTRVPFLPYPTPLRDDAGKLVGAVNMLVDIAERKRVEEALRDSEERFRKVFEGSNDAILVLDPQRNAVLEVNPAGVVMFGCRSRDEVLATPLAEFYPEDQTSFLEFMRKVQEQGAGWTDEFASRTKDGRQIASEISASCITISGARCVLLLVRDVTARKRERETLVRLTAQSEQQRRLYEAILTNTPDLAYVFDLEHRFIYANEGLLKMWGMTREEAVGKTCLELGYEPWHAAMHDREIEQVIATKQPVRGEVPFTGTFGRRIYDYIFVPVIGPNGEVEAVAGTTRDVTDRKQTIDDLNVLKNDLANQLADMQRLYEFSRRLWEQDDLNAVMHDLLLAATQLMGARKGSVQLRDHAHRGLQLISTVGFDRDFAERFSLVEASGFTTCAAALNRRARIVVEDFATESGFARLAQTVAPYGIRAAQSTPLLDRDGAVIAMLTTYFDRPYRPSDRQLKLLDLYLEVVARKIEQKRHHEHREMLLNELNHRVKNTLATVQSFAVQTLRSANTTTEGRDALEGRLVSLAKAHDVLTREHWEGADLNEVVAAALAAYSGAAQKRRFQVAGPAIRLKPKAALALSMALHELATNAVKYGALSNDAGQVSIGWEVTSADARRFDFRWLESGGPPVSLPRKRGFGSRLIEQGLAHDIAGEIELNFASGGLTCSIRAPAEEICAAVGER
ncbi:MAG TPA: PAS domain S-box protein [Xanthobacteraceae bacterium]|nr:PAS domain S-box protein [Xanthobacteraceae bacterium]